MKIEFATIGDGTNVQVILVDNDDLLVDSFYTSGHRGGVHYGEESKVPINARQLFQWVEESWAPPVIGGKLSHLHPYWHERAERKALAQQAEEEKRKRAAGQSAK